MSPRPCSHGTVFLLNGMPLRRTQQRQTLNSLWQTVGRTVSHNVHMSPACEKQLQHTCAVTFEHLVAHSSCYTIDCADVTLWRSEELSHIGETLLHEIPIGTQRSEAFCHCHIFSHRARLLTQQGRRRGRPDNSMRSLTWCCVAR